MEVIKRIARFKIYVDRARWYMAFAQFIIIVLIFLQTKGMIVGWWVYPSVIIIVLIGMILIGFIDRKLGIIKEEQRFYSTENPVIQEILKRLEKLEPYCNRKQI